MKLSWACVTTEYVYRDEQAGPDTTLFGIDRADTATHACDCRGES